MASTAGSVNGDAFAATTLQSPGPSKRPVLPPLAIPQSPNIGGSLTQGNVATLGEQPGLQTPQLAQSTGRSTFMPGVTAGNRAGGDRKFFNHFLNWGFYAISGHGGNVHHPDLVTDMNNDQLQEQAENKGKKNDKGDDGT